MASRTSQPEIQTAGKFFLLFTAFMAGFVIMALEILGFRIFAPYFGFSIYVSGTLIGIVMIALSIGAYFGGVLADKKGDYKTIFYWIFFSMIYVFITLISYKYILSFFSDLFLLGVILSAIVLFAFPMTALSMVSPYFVKLLAQEGTIGRSAGNISAIGTIGAIVGTFIPTFVLIPYLGSFLTFFISGVLLLLVVLIYFCSFDKWFLLNFLFIFTFFLQSTSTDENLIFEKESVYNLVKVVRGSSQEYQLKLNDDGNIQSFSNVQNHFNENYYYYYLNTAPLINGASTVLVLGMGAGTSPYQMIKLYDVQVDAVEIDPVVVKAAQRYFGVEEVKENLHIFVDDARPFLRRTDKRYDLIEIDMYHGGYYAPFYVLTQEFFEEVSTKLNPNGVIVINVLYPVNSKNKDVLFQSIGNTIASVFPTVFYLNLNSFNALLFASKEDVSLSEVQQRIQRNAPPQFQRGNDVAYALQEYKSNPEFNVLTDDKAPVDQLTYTMLKGIPKP